MSFITEEITGYTSEATKGAMKAPRNLTTHFFISCFTFSVSPLINTLESCNDFMILMLSFISSFKINEVNLFPALAAPCPVIFLSNLFISFKVKLLANRAKVSLAIRIAAFVSAFFPKLANQEPKGLPDWIILDFWALLSFLSAEILLAKAFLILVACFVVRNNSWGISSSSKFFLLILNIVYVLLFAAAFNLLIVHLLV